MTSFVLWAAGLAAVTSAGFRLHRAWRSLTPGTAYLCAAIALVGISAALVAPETLVAAMSIEPFPNATRLLANGLAMVAAFCVQGLLIHLVTSPDQTPQAVRRQAVLLVLTFTAMATLLVSAPIQANPDFVDVYASQPAVLGYLLLFAAYIAWSAVNFIRLIRRYVRLTDRPWLRRGLSVIQLGAGIGIGWAGWKSAAAVFVFSTGTHSTLESPVSAILSAACVGLVALGAAIPVWGPTIAKPLRWVRYRRAYRTLYPLWLTLHEAFPEIARLTKDVAGDAPRSIAWHLARRVIETRDGLLLLAPYREPATHDVPLNAARWDGRAGRDHEATVEAADIAAALGARRLGVPPAAHVPPPAQHSADFDAETAWLCRVARAYRRRSRIVAAYGPALHDRSVSENPTQAHRAPNE